MDNPQPPKKFFEDFIEGSVNEFQVAGLTADEIKDFARQYDPQLFHLDEAEAAKTHFGSLVASGFQTQLLCFRPFCDAVLLNSGSVGAPGIDKLKWLRPWYPNQPLVVTTTLIQKRLSAKSNDRGYMSYELLATADGTAILEMQWVVIMMTRQGLI